MIPDSYDAWRHCIEVECGLELTPAFIRERVQELRSPTHFKTQQFVALYGEAHRQRVIDWFLQADSNR